MIEVHSKVHCQCSARYTHMFAVDIEPKSNIVIPPIKGCPLCGKENIVSYHFEATCPSCNGFFLCDHFAENDGCTDTEYYPRTCKCGKEFYVQQRRTK